MPDELRWSVYRRGKDFSWHASKILECYSWLSSDTVVMRNSVDHVLSLIWPEAKTQELLMMWNCFMLIDDKRAKAGSGKPQDMQPEKGVWVDTRTRTMHFADED